MEDKFIIQKGDVVKYYVTINHADFDMVADDFWFVLSWGLAGQFMTIKKSELTKDEENHYFLIFDSSPMIGSVSSECHYLVPDTDMPNGLREEIDRQYIGLVTTSSCPKIHKSCHCSSEHVVYERVWRGDVNTLYLNLRTSEQEPLRDSEGKQLRVRKSETDLI